MNIKRIILITFLSFFGRIGYAADEVKDTSEQKDLLSGVNVQLILFLVGMVLFVILVRKLYEIRDGHSRRKKQPAGGEVKNTGYVPKYWFQCKNCRLTIRKETVPKTAECYNAIDHNWTQLGEVGTTKYLCKNCNTLVNTKTEPVVENCPQSEVHKWEKLN